eukprot:450537-Pyramimonas_sp.AAC.1
MKSSSGGPMLHTLSLLQLGDMRPESVAQIGVSGLKQGLLQQRQHRNFPRRCGWGGGRMARPF